MDDLLNNFADQSIKSPIEEDYIYHFFDSSPAGSGSNRPVRPAPAAPAIDNNDPFFDIEDPVSLQATGGANEDERDYNADIDDDDNDDYEHRHSKASRFDDYPETPASDAAYIGKSRVMDDTDDLDRSFRNQNGGTLKTNGVNSRKKSEHVEPSLAPSDSEEEMDGFKQHLRRLHRQDSERDELLAVCPPPPARFILTLESANPAQQQLHQENLDLKRILKESVPGSNSRAEAAERSLFEIRKSLVGLAIKVVPTRFANS